MKLLQRLPLRSKAAPAPEPSHSRFAVLEDLIVERLQLRRMQAFYDDLLSLEGAWLWLIPVLLWYGWRTYTRERGAVLVRKRILKQLRRSGSTSSR